MEHSLKCLGIFSLEIILKEKLFIKIWEFLTERLGTDKELLSVTVYEEDDEAYAIWRNEIGCRK